MRYEGLGTFPHIVERESVLGWATFFSARKWGGEAEILRKRVGAGGIRLGSGRLLTLSGCMSMEGRTKRDQSKVASLSILTYDESPMMAAKKEVRLLVSDIRHEPRPKSRAIRKARRRLSK